MWEEKADEKQFVVLLGAIAVAGLSVRFALLDTRPVHYDEAVHALYTWKFATDGVYYYSPWKHGPVMYYSTVPFFDLFEPSVISGRRVAALCSAVMILGIALLRTEFRRLPLVVTSLILAFHPLFISVSTLFRTDIYAATSAVFLLGFMYLFIKTGSENYMYGIFIASVVFVASKEVAYIVIPFVVLPVVVYKRGAIREIGVTRLVKPGLVGVVVFIALFVGWPPRILQSLLAVPAAIFAWMPLSPAPTGSGGLAPTPFYLEKFLIHAPVVLFLAAVGLISTIRRVNQFDWKHLVFLSWVVGTGLLLSIHSHKTSWNAVHIFTPVAFLAGFGLSHVYEVVSNRVSGDVVAVIPVIIITVLVVLSVLTGPVLLSQSFDGSYSPHSSFHEQSWERVRTIALTSNCPVLFTGRIGLNAPSLWPAKYYLRGHPLAYARDTGAQMFANRSFRTYQYRYEPSSVGRYSIPFFNSGSEGQIVDEILSDEYIVVSDQKVYMNDTKSTIRTQEGRFQIYIHETCNETLSGEASS